MEAGADHGDRSVKTGAGGDEALTRCDFYETVINGIQDEIVVVDRDFRVVEANDAALARFDRPRQAVVGQPCFRLYHGQEEPCADPEPCPVRQTIQTGLPSQAVRSGRRPDGSEGCYRVVGFPMLDEAGQVSRVIKISRDITERVRAEEALKASEANYRAIFNAVNDAIFVHDFQTGAVIDVNDKMCEMYGYSREEVLSLPLEQGSAGGPEAVAEGLRRIKLAAGGEPQLFEWWARHKSGRPFWVEVNLQRAVVDGQDRLLAVVRDIDARKRAEEALKTSEANYRAIFNAANDAIFVHDIETGAILDVNEKMCEMYGYTPEEARSIDVETLSTGVPPCTQADALRWIMKAANGEPQLFEWRARHKSGRPFWVEVNLRRAAVEGRGRLLAVVRDIDDRKRAQEALLESERRYRALVDNAPVGVFRLTAEGEVLYANQAVADMLGYERPEETYGRRDVEFYVDPARREEMKVELEAVGRVSGAEIELKTKQGEVRTFILSVYFQGGVAEGMLVDITDRKRAEEALRESEERFRNLMEHIPGVAIQGYGPDGTVFYWNKASEEVYGWQAHEAIGRDLGELIIPDDIKPHYHQALKLAASMTRSGEFMPAGEIVLQRKDGSGVPVYSIHTAVCLEGRDPILFCIDVDLSERKRAEEALREGERFLSSIFSSILDGLCVLDDQLNIVRLNPALERCHPHEPAAVGQKCYRALRGLSEPCPNCPSLRTLQNGEPAHEVIPKAGPDGEPTGWLEIHTFPFIDQASGQVKGVIEYVRDMTGRYQAERRLLEETRLTEGIVDGCPVAMFVIDRDHKLVHWNRACEELTGCKREEMLGTDRQWEPFYEQRRPVMADVLVNGDMAALKRLYAAHGLTQAPLVRDAFKGEGYFEKLGGRHLYFLAAPLYDAEGNVLGAIETLQDVTETKGLERRLQDYSRQLEATIAELETKTRKLEGQEATQRAYNQLLTILNSIDINQILRRSLQSIVEQAGCQLGLIYLREKPEDELRLMAFHSIDAGALDAPLLQPAPGGLPARVIQEGRRVVIHEIAPDARFTFNLGLGQVQPRSVAALPVTFREQVLGVLVVASLERLTPDTLAFLENCLRQVAVAINNALAFGQIERQSQELASINRELAEASRLKSEFVANISHELRTPLNSILGFSDILLKNREGNLSERQMGNVEKIRRNGAGLLSLINSILELSKAEAGKIEAVSEPTNVRQVVEQCVEGVRPLAEKAGLELVLEPVGELPIIRSDGGKIGQIITNLLSNAIKFTEEGRVMVRVRKRRRREDPVEILVEDTGIGIASQHLDDIFKEFKQLDGAASRRYDGTGLGLSISKRLAELLGGQITVESETGKGSTFTFRLPVSRQEETAITPLASVTAPQVGAARQARSGGKLVLLIGADADCAQAVEAQAEELGCELRVCASGQEALKRVAELSPHVVVLDLSLPDHNGWEILGDLKRAETPRDLPVVIISALDDRKRAYYLGASEFLARPLEADQVRSALARVLRPARGRILVVDDEPDVLEAIREWLGGSVGEVCPARNGVEALRQLEARRPDAVFLDLMMPQMDGYEFLKRVRQIEGCAELPVVVVTGKQLGPTELARLEDGATSVIQKGVTAQAQVMQQLERIVSRLN